MYLQVKNRALESVRASQSSRCENKQWISEGSVCRSTRENSRLEMASQSQVKDCNDQSDGKAEQVL